MIKEPLLQPKLIESNQPVPSLFLRVSPNGLRNVQVIDGNDPSYVLVWVGMCFGGTDLSNTLVTNYEYEIRSDYEYIDNVVFTPESEAIITELDDGHHSLDGHVRFIIKSTKLTEISVTWSTSA